MRKLIRKYLTLVNKIPERHYWPGFIFFSLYFVVPYSEFTVTALVLIYFAFERLVRRINRKLNEIIPDWIRIGGSIIFFLVMMDDTLMYLSILAIAYYSNKKAKEIASKDEALQEK